MTIESHHRINLDEARRLILVELGGFWTAETAHHFIAEFRAAIAAAGATGMRFATFCDATRLDVQSGGTVEVLRSFFGTADLGDGKGAVLVDKALLRLQAARIVGTTVRFFSERDEAMAWLAEP